MPDGPDDDLVARFAQGDREAFETLFRRHQQEVFRWALRIVREAGLAEDVTVEAFWRAYRGRARFDPSRSFGAWMRRIATNAALTHVRAQGRRRRDVPLDGHEPAVPAAADRRIDIRQAFSALPPRLRLVATLALIEEQPYAEIADALGVPIGTVKSRVFRAVRLLRQELARRGIRG